MINNINQWHHFSLFWLFPVINFRNTKAMTAFIQNPLGDILHFEGTLQVQKLSPYMAYNRPFLYQTYARGQHTSQ